MPQTRKFWYQPIDEAGESFEMLPYVANPRVRLFVASFLLLYFELVMIRWIPGHVRVLAYFTNFILIACFLGMGLGLMLSRSKRDLSPFLAGGIALLMVLAVIFEWVWVGNDGLMIYLDYEGPPKKVLALGPVLIAFYVGIALAFAPFGQVIGRAFQGNSLADYSTNLLGSITGIAVFSIYSFLALPAWCWFLLGLPFLLMLVPPRFPSRFGTAAISALLVFVVWNLDRGTIWSPYHKLEIVPARFDPKTPNPVPLNLGSDAEQLPIDVGFIVRVNNDFYQLAMDLSDEAVARYPVLGLWRDANFTICNLHRPLERVLIVGGGRGMTPRRRFDVARSTWTSWTSIRISSRLGGQCILSTLIPIRPSTSRSMTRATSSMARYRVTTRLSLRFWTATDF
jgi:hypothetical protein